MLSQYDYYGTEQAPPKGDKPPMPKDGKKDKKMSPLMMAMALVPIGDLFVYYKVNDEFSGNDDSWSKVANVALAGAAIKIVGIAAHKMMKMKAMAMVVPAVSTIQSAAQLYLINDAEGTTTYSSTNMLYGITGFNFVISAANAAMGGKKGGKKGDKPPKKEDKGDKPAPGGNDNYYGYY